MDFKDWMKKLDAICYNRLGLSIHDLQDMCFRDAFDDGVSPEDFFEEEVRFCLETEYGDLVDDLF